MTPEEFVEEMTAIKSHHYDLNRDKETTHILMDNLMCRVMKELGYDEGIDIFERTDKYYT